MFGNILEVLPGEKDDGYFKACPHKKTGPEAGQYFHVRPPIGFI